MNAFRTERVALLASNGDQSASQALAKVEALAAADVLEIGHGHGPVHHFHQIWDH